MPLHEPVVRQATAGALETVALEPKTDLRSEISDLKSETAGKEPEAKIDLPAKTAGEPGDSRTGSEAHPTVAPAGAARAPDPVPGMAGGSQVPPDLMQAVDTLMRDKFKRRTPGGRSEGVRYGGGTPQSEEAVERAIHWLVAHQRQDGSWNFNHVERGLRALLHQSRQRAQHDRGHGLALLPFLGAGYTHKQGEFQGVWYSEGWIT